MGPYERGDGIDAHEVARTADAIRERLKLPPELSEAVRTAVGASQERTGVAYIDAEIAALPSRFGLEADKVAAPAVAAQPSESAGPALTFLSHCCPPVASAGAIIHRSFRVRANRHLIAQGHGRTGLTYRWDTGAEHWLKQRLRRWRSSATTFMPVDVAAGREITVSVPIRTPGKAGAYALSLICGNTSIASIPMEIVNGALPVVETLNQNPDYGADHQAALDMLEAYLDGRYRRPRVMLEVASGVNPHLLRFSVAGDRVIATDICSNMMQLGALYAYHHMPQTRGTLGFAAVDAFDTPFRPAQFDVVALFSALHHFPDPVAFLDRLKQLLKPDGVVAVMCEPCDPVTAVRGEGYRRDLMAGINEQVFAVEEYRHIFARAGLKEVAMRDDGGSLKAILSAA